MGPWCRRVLEGGFTPRDAVIPIKEITGFEEAQAPGQGQGKRKGRSGHAYAVRTHLASSARYSACRRLMFQPPASRLGHPGFFV
jgi:hypothetical protein